MLFRSVSQMAAQAAQQLLQQHQQEAQQQLNQQQAQDPLIQLQQQELALKGQDLQRKTQKDMSDAALKAQQLQIERERIAANQESEGAKLAAKIHGDREQRSHAHEEKGFSAGVDMHKHGLTLSHQQQIARYQAERSEEHTSELSHT